MENRKKEMVVVAVENNVQGGPGPTHTTFFFRVGRGLQIMLREGRGEWLESTPKSASAIFEGEDHKCLNSPPPPQKTITLKNVADRSAQTTEQPSPYLFSDFPLRGVPATTVGQLTTIFSFLL